MFEVVTEVFVADAFELFASDAGVDESLDFYRAEELIGDVPTLQSQVVSSLMILLSGWIRMLTQ